MRLRCGFCAIVALTILKFKECGAGDIQVQGPSEKIRSSLHGQSYSDSERYAPRSCAEIQLSGHARVSGVYTIQLLFDKELQVYCDLETDGGGWTVFQRRADFPPPINFFRNWASYKTGFGNLDREFWLGLDNINSLSSYEPSSLRVDLGDFEGGKRYAKYSRFHVSDEGDKYRLLVDGFSGDAGDSLANQNGQQFTTMDSDNDAYKDNCAVVYSGAWWYNACHYSNLNGKYLRGNHTTFADGVEWYSWHGYNYSLKTTEMKMRPVDFPIVTAS